MKLLNIFITIVVLLIFACNSKNIDEGSDSADSVEKENDDNYFDSADTSYIDNTTDGDNASDKEETPDFPVFEDEELLPPPSDSFLIQWGGGLNDFVQDVALSNNGEIYITGAKFDETSSHYEFFAASFSAEGNELWMHQIKSGASHYGNSIAFDSQGNVFVAGRAGGSMDDEQSESGNIILVKFDKNGALKWIRQWGEAADYEMANAVAIDSKGNVFVTGSMTADDGSKCNVFLAKYTTDGEKEWVKQWGTDFDNRGEDIVIDDKDNIFVLGTWELEADVFLGKYSTDGTEVWKKTWGTDGNNRLSSMAIDNDGNFFIAGEKNPDMGGTTAIEKRDVNGDLLWSRSIPGSKTYVNNKGFSVAVNESGNIFVTGFTAADIGVNVSAGKQDAFLVEFRDDGEAVWGKLWGTPADEHGTGVAVDNNGNIIVAGTTEGNLTDALSADGNIFLLSIKSP